jgi:hypothetical protein
MLSGKEVAEFATENSHRHADKTIYKRKQDNANLTLIRRGFLASSGHESMYFFRSRSRYSKTR